MTQILKDIDYKNIFKYFEEISAVPRGSYNNQAISDYLVDFAKKRNLYVKQDELLNVIIIKEATKGYEHCDAVILQGHMDMVCIKDSDAEHDFEKDGLKLAIEGDYIRATGTTLGGDNGIAIAYALAILDSDEIVHPRLEVIITTDEEVGLLGATGLDVSECRAKYMLNLDSEEESSILVGCAGGMTSTSEVPMVYEPVTGSKIEVMICGLQGGHSGVEAAKNRTNANLLMARLLTELQGKVEFRVAHMEGGLKDNAIPHESKAELVVASNQVSAVVAAIKELEAVYQYELHAAEPGVRIEVKEGECKEYSCLTKESLQKVVFFIQYQPNGIQAMSANITGLVESSLNLGIFAMDEKKAIFSYSVRSSFATYKQYLSAKLANFTEFLGGTYQTKGEYPAWEYKADSKLRDTMIELYKEEFGREPIIEAIHAGLECGILAEKMNGLDIVSIGPDMMDVHTPKERLSISSTIRVFDYIVNVLKALCK